MIDLFDKGYFLFGEMNGRVILVYYEVIYLFLLYNIIIVLMLIYLL